MIKRIPLVFVLLISILFISATPKPFRKLSAEEKTTVKKFTRLVNRKDGTYHVLIMTNYGNMVVRLFNETPLHRDNFVDKVKSGFYDSLLFHRVINNFMIQGGDPTSKKATKGQTVGSGSAPGPQIPAEFRTDKGIYHKRGALAAARDNNPQKASSNCQFYIVQRKTWRTGQLDSTVVSRRLDINEEQKKIYTTVGGTPHLDGGYTVFGELEIGEDVLDQIAATKTERGDRPVEDIRMRLFLLNEIEKGKKK